jgi:hypothetical protein
LEYYFIVVLFVGHIRLTLFGLREQPQEKFFKNIFIVSSGNPAHDNVRAHASNAFFCVAVAAAGLGKDDDGKEEHQYRPGLPMDIS